MVKLSQIKWYSYPNLVTNQAMTADMLHTYNQDRNLPHRGSEQARERRRRPRPRRRGVGLDTPTFHHVSIVRQNAVFQLMTAGTSHVTNLTPGSGCNPTGVEPVGGTSTHSDASSEGMHR